MGFGFSVDNSYLLGPKDVLGVLVFSRSTESGLYERTTNEALKQEISLNGYIDLPIIGLIEINNKSINEVKSILEAKYNKYLLDAKVELSLVQAKTIPVYVLGEVIFPGLYEVDDGNDSVKNIYAMIQMAKGFTSEADKRNITIRRGDKSFNIDLVAGNLDKIRDIKFQKDDLIYVEKRFNKVYVLGQVLNPGWFPYVENSKVMDYISHARGMLESAGDEVVVLVGGKTDKDSIRRIKINHDIGVPLDNLAVEPGTVVFVPKGVIANWEFLLRQLQNVRDALYYPSDISNQLRNLGNI